MTDEFIDLKHHGDRDVEPGLVDLAVNVRPGGTPAWLTDHLAAVDLSAYPDQTEALDAVARRHGRPPSEVLLTAGAAEAFVLIARTLRPQKAAIVNPQFTEPEVALSNAGHPVARINIVPPFTLDFPYVSAEPDLVVVGNPNNPTSVLTPRTIIEDLCRPGRTVVVDEAFADCVPGEAESLAGKPSLDGLIVIRSLTKTWAIPGLRVGYVLAPTATIDALRLAQPAWPVSSPALAALVACSTPQAVAEAEVWARRLGEDRAHLLAGLRSRLPRLRVVPNAQASFVLLHTDKRDVRQRLLDRGFAVRRGETFPGLTSGWIRVAVRDPATSDAFLDALVNALA